MIKIILSIFISLCIVGALGSCSALKNDWRTASREPAGIAADPKITPQAIIEVYAADAFSWRGWFAVHTWIAIKEKDAIKYSLYEVVGWRVKSGLPALRVISTSTPDRYWYGSRPEKILYIEGADAETLIPQVVEAIEKYPFADEYTLFPGPNSNTFPAWIGLQVPALGLEMPFNAIGSGYAD